jgi:hypothetical protein
VYFAPLVVLVADRAVLSNRRLVPVNRIGDRDLTDNMKWMRQTISLANQYIGRTPNRISTAIYGTERKIKTEFFSKKVSKTY